MINYSYHYAEIDPETNMCVGVYSATCESDDPNWVAIPEYDNVFCFKYYDFETGKWYHDAAMTQEFIYE